MEKVCVLLKRLTLVPLQDLQDHLRESQVAPYQVKVPYIIRYECPDWGSHANPIVLREPIKFQSQGATWRCLSEG